ncbi:MAG: class GN sortase [Xanthomonadales bacterium]|nr:class GN sortase [Xanthomonadales bacterium]
MAAVSAIAVSVGDRIPVTRGPGPVPGSPADASPAGREPHPESSRTGAACRIRLLLAALLGIAALATAADAGWIHGKAALAQWLLERAWQRGLVQGEAPPPWPWADTRPVARLLRPDGGAQIVLAGDSGRVLAFGPGWAPASAAPGQPGTTVVSGHRDTHFAWLRQLQPGDRIGLDDGTIRRDYLVHASRVVDSRRTGIGLDHETGDRLLLVTCWPFDAVSAGGPLRYVVEAVPAPGPA